MRFSDSVWDSECVLRFDFFGTSQLNLYAEWKELKTEAHLPYGVISNSVIYIFYHVLQHIPPTLRKVCFKVKKRMHFSFESPQFYCYILPKLTPSRYGDSKSVPFEESWDRVDYSGKRQELPKRNPRTLCIISRQQWSYASRFWDCTPRHAAKNVCNSDERAKRRERLENKYKQSKGCRLQGVF